jgi:hypothetical protein
LRAKFGGSFAQGIQHFLLARRRGLLLSQSISAQAIYGFEADDVLTANIGYGAANVCLAVGTLAEFASDIRGEARIRWLGHHSQRSHNLVIEKHIEVRRLAQRNAKRLLYGVIENRIASGVGKIPNDNHVLFGKLGSSSARVIKIACRRENSDQ